MQHPNSIPIIPKTMADIDQLAKEMLRAADAYAVTKQQVYSTTETEVAERSKQEMKRHGPNYILDLGISRCLMFEQQSIISVCVTLEILPDEKPHYRLSITRLIRLTHPASPLNYAPVPKEWAELIANRFFGSDAVAVPNPTGIETAKHYVKYLPEYYRLIIDLDANKFFNTGIFSYESNY